jgi:hypothetical protein
MSILLDALKKSEEQRKLGATPDIHGSLATGPDDVVTVHQWLPLSMMAVSVIVMAWFGWQQYREPEMEAVVISPSAESEAGVEIPPGFGDQATRSGRAPDSAHRSSLCLRRRKVQARSVKCRPPSRQTATRNSRV